MKELQEKRLFIYSTGLLVSSSVERIITTILERQINLLKTNPFLYHSLSLVMLIGLFIVTNVTIKWLINREWVSKSVYGNRYVGGHWIEIVYEETNGKDVASHYCDLEIGYDIDKIYLSGTDYDNNFKFRYNLETESASIDNYCLSYLFKCIDGEKSWKGYGDIVFHKRVRSRPNRYTGRFRDDENRRFRVEGYLISDKEERNKLDKDFLSGFREIIRKRNIVSVESEQTA